MEKGNKFYHKIDKYIGIPLVFLLGILKKKKKNLPKNINRIGVLKTASIGDTVLMSAVLKDIRQEYPNAEITFFIATSNYELSLMINSFDKLVRLDLKNIIKTINLIRSKGS